MTEDETVDKPTDLGVETGSPTYLFAGEKVRVDTRRRDHAAVLPACGVRNTGLTIRDFVLDAVSGKVSHYRFNEAMGDHPIERFMPADAFEEVVGVLFRKDGADWFVPTDGTEPRHLSEEFGRRAYNALFVTGASKPDFLGTARFGQFVIAENDAGWRLDAIVSLRTANVHETTAANAAIERHQDSSAPTP